MKTLSDEITKTINLLLDSTPGTLAINFKGDNCLLVSGENYGKKIKLTIVKGGLNSLQSIITYGQETAPVYNVDGYVNDARAYANLEIDFATIKSLVSLAKDKIAKEITFTSSDAWNFIMGNEI